MSTKETRIHSINPDGSPGGAVILVDHRAGRMDVLSPETRIPLAYALGQRPELGTYVWQVVDACDMRQEAWVWVDNKEDAVRALQRIAGRYQRS